MNRWTHRLARTAVLTCALAACGGGSGGSAASSPAPAPLSGVSITGRLIWHSYDTYGFAGVRSWMADFSTGSVVEITPSRVLGAMNFQFSPDGTEVVMMGDDATGSAALGGAQGWDIWIAQVGATGLANVTRLTNALVDGSRNEDPKFSPDGSHVVFKRDLDSLVAIDLAQVQVNGADQSPAQTVLLSGSTELSMPYYLAGNSGGLLYANGANLDSIRLLSGGVSSVLYSLGTHDYYPVAISPTQFYFVSGQSPGNNDWILRGDTSASTALPAAFITAQVATYEFADPSPMGGNWLAYASTVPGGSGSYDIWIGNFSTGQSANLSAWIAGANHANQDLGPTFHGTISP